MWTDRRTGTTDMTTPTVAFHSFANASKKLNNNEEKRTLTTIFVTHNRRMQFPRVSIIVYCITKGCSTSTYQNKAQLVATCSTCSGVTLHLVPQDGFGGLVVSMLASGTQVCGFKPGRSRWIFTGVKILSMPTSGGEVKESVPCPTFAACQRT